MFPHNQENLISYMNFLVGESRFIMILFSQLHWGQVLIFLSSLISPLASPGLDSRPWYVCQMPQIDRLRDKAQSYESTSTYNLTWLFFAWLCLPPFKMPFLQEALHDLFAFRLLLCISIVPCAYIPMITPITFMVAIR